MLGAVGASVLTATSRKLRVAAIAQLPTEVYHRPNDEYITIDATDKGVNVVKLLAGISSNSAALMGKIHTLADIVTDKAADDFLGHLSTRAPNVHADLQVRG